MHLSDDTLRLLLDDGPWTRERLADLERSVGSAADARRVLGRWQHLHRSTREQLDSLVPDSSDLVLVGLDRSGRTDLLSARERDRLAGARASIEEAESAMPALSDVIAAVGRDADSFDAAWRAAFAEGPRRVDRPARRPVRMRRVLSRLAIAASVVAFAAVSVLVLQRDRADVTATADAGMRIVELEDGSTVRLMEGASLSWNDHGFDRRVSLDGRAFFDVSHDGMPFSVLTPSATVTVLGTSFAVTSGPDDTEVMLVTGRVAVASAHDPEAMVVLDPGERTRVALGGAPETPGRVDTREALDWTGMLFFRSTTLGEAVRILESVHGVRVEVDPSIANEPVTGTFARDRDAGEVIGILATALGARTWSAPDGTLHVDSR